METLTLILAVLIGLIGLQYVLWRKSNKLKKLGVLHPTSWPFIGNCGSVLCLRSHFSDLIENIYRFNEQADYVGFYDFGEPVIMIRSPELMKSIVIKNFDHFTDHRNFLDPELNPLFSKNLFTLRGEKWKEVRNLLSPAFTGSKMKHMFELMSFCGKNFVDCLMEVAKKKSRIIDSKESFTRYTNDVIASCAFGISVDSMKDPKNDFYVLGKDATNFGGIRGLKVVISRFSPMLGKIFSGSLVPAKAELFFENVVRETIETRDREGITRPDMIQLLMESRGKKLDKSQELTIHDMTAQAFVFFFAGFDSTATAMCLVAHELAMHFEIQDKLREEVDNVMRESNGDVTYEMINGMKYLEAVVNETLRLYPINLFLDRVCVKSFQLPAAFPGGKPITIEPGQNVWYPVFSIHRDPKYFPNPEKFDPERFMGAKSNGDPFTYLPFGQGPRMCIGNRFALLEIKVLILNLLAQCYLKPLPDARSPIEIKKASFNLMPTKGFWLEIVPRDVAQFPIQTPPTRL